MCKYVISVTVIGELVCLERQQFFIGFEMNAHFSCFLAKTLELMCLFSSPTSSLSFHFNKSPNNMHWSLQLKGASNRITSLPASPRFQIQNVIHAGASLHSLLQLHLFHSRCTLLSTNLWPYWTRLKVQRAICHATLCLRQNAQTHFMSSGHTCGS